MEGIAYKIKRGRRKTMSLNIERDGSVLVRAPIGTGSEDIEDFVFRHRAWLEKNSQIFAPFPSIFQTVPSSFSSERPM